MPGRIRVRLAKRGESADLRKEMKFSTAFLDEIRARVPSPRSSARASSCARKGREWAGPVAVQRGEDAVVLRQRSEGFYHDFSSGKHGDIFTFLIETEGLTFPEAVERLAAMAGLPMPARDARERGARQKRASLHEVLALAARIFDSTLHEPRAPRRAAISPTGASTRRRSASSASATPRRTASPCATRWPARGVDARAMIEAGLLVHGEEIAVPYDRFRDRVMFPIHDRSGRVVAFGGRALEPGAKAKYLNSPETELFHKGSLLFNHHRARKSRPRERRVIVVEGYVDVIAMTQAGFPRPSRRSAPP